MNYPLRTALGFIVRLLVVTPFALLLVNLGAEAAAMNNNISVFLLIVLLAVTIIYLAVMIFVPAEYCIRTAIDLIEFHCYKPQAIMVYISATLALGLVLAMAAMAFFWTGMVLLLYAVSLYTWPLYIKRIDAASKAAMLAQLSPSK